MAKKRKKSLVGWTYKKWNLHWDFIAGFGEGVVFCEILKKKQPSIFNLLRDNEENVKVRVTIEEL